MSVVVADTSPINYLVLIDCIDLLRQIYGAVLIPSEVLTELQCADTPGKVAQWVGALPDWVEVRPAIRGSAIDDPAMQAIDMGERSAIILASQYEEVLLLMDDAAGRAVAAARGLIVVGTLGVLRAASRSGLIDLGEVLPKLLATNFRVARSLVDQLLDQR